MTFVKVINKKWLFVNCSKLMKSFFLKHSWWHIL